MNWKQKIKSNPITFKIAHTLHYPIVQAKVWKERYPLYKKETKQDLEILSHLTSKNKKVFFCGIPTHNNLGDQAQYYCIQKWIRDNLSDYECVELCAFPFYSRTFQKKLDEVVKDDDIFLIQSGYCTIETHYNHYMHRYIASHYLKNKILIMPQTVNFKKEKEGFKTGAIYDAHKHLVFLARDQKSCELAYKYFKDTKILLYPDIVTSLIGTLSFDTQREGVLICVRNDGEKLYSDEQIQTLKKQISSQGIPVSITDTNYSFSDTRKIEDILMEKLKQFAKYKVVITDRYHGTIFSMIANTPVIVLATKDHKVRTGTEWFRGIYDGAYFNANTLEEAVRIANKIIESQISISNKAYFKEEYYDILKKYL